MRLERDTVHIRVARVPVIDNVALVVEHLVRRKRDEEAAAAEEILLVLLGRLVTDTGEVQLLPLEVALDVVGLEEARRELLLQAPRVPLRDGHGLTVAKDDAGLTGRVDVADDGLAVDRADLASEGAVRLGGEVELALAVAEAEAAAVVARGLGDGEGNGGQGEEEGCETGHWETN